MRTAVRGDDQGDAEPRDPVVNEGFGAVSGTGGREGNDLRPSSIPVNNGVEVGMARRGRKRTDE